MTNFYFPHIGIEEMIRNRGQVATLVEYSKATDSEGNVIRDDHGDVTWEETRRDINVVKGFQTSTKLPVRINNEMGQYRTFDFEFYTTEVDYTEVPAVGKTPDLIYEGRVHSIVEVENATIGVTRLICEARRV